jgi:hypothetical protein
MYYSNYSIEEKMDISKQLKDHTDEKAFKDFCSLKNKIQTELNSIKPLSPVGLKFIENYIHIELLSTKSKQGISFYDFWYNREFYMSRDKSTKKLIDSIKNNKPYLTDIKIGKQVFNLYYGSICIFRPTISAKLYSQFKPKVILDFTMGWGGRLVGATLSDVKKYIGIDSNINLIEPYQKMTDYLKTQSTTEIDLHFEDALKIDYSKLDYDMVFTSPPFYNKEIYGNKDTYKTKEEWNENFYKPIFKLTWDNLKRDGYYCLNIPIILYETICIPLLGDATEMIELNKYSRLLPKKETKQFNVGQKYKEFIYIWKK